MPHKLMRVHRAPGRQAGAAHQVMLGIAGDSAAGKTTLPAGWPRRSGRSAARRYAWMTTTATTGTSARACRSPRWIRGATTSRSSSSTSSSFLLGQPILKPVYNHSQGTLERPVLVEPREFVIVEGLLPLAFAAREGLF